MTKKIRRFLLAAVVLSALFYVSQALAGQKAVVKVNETVLTEADLQEVMNRIIPAASFHGTMSPERKAAYRPRAIEELIEEELLYQGAKERGMTVKKSRIKETVKATIKRLGGKKNFKTALKRANLTKKQYERKLEKKFLINRIIRLEVEQKASVSDEQVREHYERNRKGYMRPEARRLRHILISVEPAATGEQRRQRRQRAEEVLRKAGEGQDFSQLAWDYSDDPYRVKGGDLGLIHRGRLDPDLEEAVFSLEAGQVSGIIETIYGYHIVRVEEVRKPEQLSFKDVSQKIRRQMRQKKLKELKSALITGFRENARIEVY